MQRRGRAGRVQPGECYKLYTRSKFASFAQFQVPELLRMPLFEVCLQVRTLQQGKIGDILARAIEPPQSHAVKAAVSLLQDLGALDDNEDITILGKHLAKLPLDPRMGKMIILGTIFQCLDPVMTIAVCHSNSNDPFVIPSHCRETADSVHMLYSVQSQSDHIALVNAYSGFVQALAVGTEREYCDKNFLSLSNMKMIMRTKEQLVQVLRDSKFLDSSAQFTRGVLFSPVLIYLDNNELIKGIICAGLFPSIARHTGKKREFSSKVDHLLLLHPSSTIYTMNKQYCSPWVVFSEKVQTTKCYIKTASILSDFALFLFGSHLQLIPTPSGGATVRLDDWECFLTESYDTANLLVEMRAALDRFISRRIEAPHTQITPLDKSILIIILQLVNTPSLNMRTSPLGGNPLSNNNNNNYFNPNQIINNNNSIPDPKYSSSSHSHSSSRNDDYPSNSSSRHDNYPSSRHDSYHSSSSSSSSSRHDTHSSSSSSSSRHDDYHTPSSSSSRHDDYHQASRYNSNYNNHHDNYRNHYNNPSSHHYDDYYKRGGRR